MAGTSIKKRPFSDGTKGKPQQRPTKKQKQMAAYHSSSEEEDSGDDEGGAMPAHLLDSDDEDFDNLEADDGASTDASDSDSDSEGDDLAPKPKSSSTEAAAAAPQSQPKPETKQKKFVAKDAPDSGDSADENDDNEEEGSEEDEDADSHSDSDGLRSGANRAKSKRNDPDAFATSISKMLSSKLPVSKRADPIVARSAAAAANSKQLVDSVLEVKARKRLREQKRLAMEKGRVRDVLVASTTRTLNMQTGEIEEVVQDGAETTGQILATERRLRKVAQRGVVKLFNAVRAAQVKAVEAERAARDEGIVGSKRKEEKITQMSRKGFLDLIANGGGGLKKGGLEEA